MSEKRTTTGVDRSRAASPWIDFVEVDLVLRGLVRPHDGVPRAIDAEITVAPGVHAIEVERVLDVPGPGVRRLAGCVFH